MRTVGIVLQLNVSNAQRFQIDMLPFLKSAVIRAIRGKRNFLTTKAHMNADTRGLKHEALTGKILKAFYEVYNELGHGFLESVCRRAMVVALTEAGCRVVEKFIVPVWFRGQIIGNFEADLMVDQTVILELKIGPHARTRR
jgi:PD-(D/E)XK nuclease superfamily